jgi:hypothetical protein
MTKNNFAMLKCFNEFIVKVVDRVWELVLFFEIIIDDKWRMTMVDEMNFGFHTIKHGNY